MGKRSKFKRNPRDLYKTPESAVLPLLPHIEGRGLIFIEPCAGDAQLTKILIDNGLKCGWQSDIEPGHDDVKDFDALELLGLELLGDIIITNPPWEKRKHKGELFNKLLRHWLETFRGDIWLLFDADWIHTKQALEFKDYCVKIVSVGRVSWMENGTSGKDNCAWYLFNRDNTKDTEFVWRAS